MDLSQKRNYSEHLEKELTTILHVKNQLIPFKSFSWINFFFSLRNSSIMIPHEEISFENHSTKNSSEI